MKYQDFQVKEIESNLY